MVVGVYLLHISDAHKNRVGGAANDVILSILKKKNILN